MEEVTEQCGYHLGPPVSGCRQAQLNHNPREGEWQEALWLCPDCRECLRGYFRYVKETP